MQAIHGYVAGSDPDADARLHRLATHGIRGADLDDLLLETLTPSHGFLLPVHVPTHPWLCHMCAKKFMSEVDAQRHLLCKLHRQKRRAQWKMIDCIKWNSRAVAAKPPFYEIDVDIYQTVLGAVVRPQEQGTLTPQQQHQCSLRA